MLSRNEIKEYALDICIPLMERCAERAKRGIYAEKADQVGFIPSFLENFCRPFWGIAPIIAEGEEIVLKVGGEDLTVSAYMRRVLKNCLGSEGSFEKFKKYFSDHSYENQNITEFAGLLIGIFFARKQLWEPLDEEEKRLYATELYEMALDAFDNSWPNNHYWFPLFAVTVLKRLGFEFDETERMLRHGLDFLDRLYEGEGWYSDGVFGRFDYYEAWSLHMYPLLWTLIADESFSGYAERKREYIRRTNEFLDFFTHWFDERGAQVPFGRSLSYRFAASALFPAAVMAGCEIDPGLAGSITAANIEFFKNNVRTDKDSILPEGYLYGTPCVVEGYTSDGGAYWCCKTFLALLMPEEHPFWRNAKVKFPAQTGDFSLHPKHSKINLVFEGENGLVTMYNNTSQYYQNGIHTHHFGNMRNWYAKFAYNSGAGFACSSPDVTAFDCMISLITPDDSMTSHRLGFEDLGYEGKFLHSRHTPFANDEKSVIETWILPLKGVHVRVHRVVLSQRYFVAEGGFSLGRWNDCKPQLVGEKTAELENEEMYSSVACVSDVPVEYEVRDAQAGYHLYAPLASYPAYKTREALKAGKYIFATVVACGKKEDKKMLPSVDFCGRRIEIRYKNETYILEPEGGKI